MDRLIKLDKQLMELDSTNKYERNEEKVLDIIDLMKKLITKLREKGVNEKNTGRLNEIAKHIRYNNNNNTNHEFYLDQAAEGNYNSNSNNNSNSKSKSKSKSKSRRKIKSKRGMATRSMRRKSGKRVH